MIPMRNSLMKSNPESIKRDIEREINSLENKKGRFSHEIKGHPNYVNQQVNLFYRNLNSEYGMEGWRLLNTSSYPIPSGCCMYIMYEVYGNSNRLQYLYEQLELCERNIAEKHKKETENQEIRKTLENWSRKTKVSLTRK